MSTKSEENHSCDDVIKRVYLYLDGELKGDEEKEFMWQINHCNSCFEKYKIEKKFKEYIISKAFSKKISTQLISTIKENIKVKAGME